MSHATEYVARTLKSARVAKGLSQRALSALSGVPQSHISKIEAGGVDLRVSSLIALARVLGLELTLVPRKTVPAVNALIRSAKRAGPLSGPARKRLNRLQKTLDTLLEAHPQAANLTQKPTADILVKVPPVDNDLAEIQHLVRALQNFALSKEDLDGLQTINSTLQNFKDNQKGRISLPMALMQLQGLRSRLARSSADRLATDSAGPAYSLEEDADA